MKSLLRGRTSVRLGALYRRPLGRGAAGFAALLVMTAFMGLSSADPRSFGIGVSLGSPMGLTAVQNFDSTNAVQAALEWNIYNTFVMQGDYLFKEGAPFRRVDPAYGKPWLYYGMGARYEWGGRDISPFGPYRKTHDGRLGIRFPVGVQHYLPKAPFDAFIEVAPMLSLWPSTSLDMMMALGLRFEL